MNDKVNTAIGWLSVLAVLFIIMGLGYLVFGMVFSWHKDMTNATPQKPMTEIVAGNELPRRLETRYLGQVNQAMYSPQARFYVIELEGHEYIIAEGNCSQAFAIVHNARCKACCPQKGKGGF